MKIQIVHHRDPDDACYLEVFVDGKRHIDVEVEDIDPGRGYEEDDIADRRKEALDKANAPGATEYDVAIAEAVCQARFERFSL